MEAWATNAQLRIVKLEERFEMDKRLAEWVMLTEELSKDFAVMHQMYGYMMGVVDRWEKKK